MSAMRAILNEGLERQNAEAAAREKVLEARLEDMNDRLRLGMNKMQAAVGSKKNSSGRRGSTARSPKRSNLVMAAGKYANLWLHRLSEQLIPPSYFHQSNVTQALPQLRQIILFS